MGQRAGKLDRQIVIQTFTSAAANEFGEQTKTWQTFATVWAELKPIRARERFQSTVLRAEKAQIFCIRYLSGLEATMRISYDGLFWNIRGITEIGRREMFEVIAEAEET